MTERAPTSERLPGVLLPEEVLRDPRAAQEVNELAQRFGSELKIHVPTP